MFVLSSPIFEYTACKIGAITRELDVDGRIINGNIAGMECKTPNYPQCTDTVGEIKGIKSGKRKKKKQGNDKVSAKVLHVDGEETSSVAAPDVPEDDVTSSGIKKQNWKDKISFYIDTLSNTTNAAQDDGQEFQMLEKKLRKYLCKYYGYNKYLIKKFMSILPMKEVVELLEANEKQRPVTIRVNTLKTRRKDLVDVMTPKGVELEPVGEWSKVGLLVQESKVPIGATPQCLAGHYILQGTASLLPVMALAPQPDELILDLCAAPGGKTAYIAALMRNSGTLVANDVSNDRVTAITSNLHRLGVTNCIVCCSDGREFPKMMKGFDRVLLDAPCSGTGVVAKHAEVKTKRSAEDIKSKTELQKELILAAIDCLDADSKCGGILVYSTCSLLVEENESVVDYALKKRNVRIMPQELGIGVEGFTSYQDQKFHLSLKHTRRFYPHKHNMDGFFVAKLKKFSNSIPLAV